MPRLFELRASLISGLLAVVLSPAPSLAQLPSVPQEAAPGPSGNALQRAPITSGSDPVVGSVDGKLIYLSDLTRVTNTLPD